MMTRLSGSMGGTLVCSSILPDRTIIVFHEQRTIP